MFNSLLSADSIISVLAATIRLATPILLAALGGVYAQRAGILNLGMEGTMTMGAALAFITAYHSGSLLLGVLAAIVTGVVYNLIMAWISVTMKANQVIAGTALTILGVGLAAFIYRNVFGIQSLPPQVEAFSVINIPALSKIPVIGPILFKHNILIYIAYLLVPFTWVVLEKTVFGLNIKTVGEHPRAADSKGIGVAKTRYAAMMIEGAYAGMAGAFMSLGYMNIFLDGIVGGRGFIAVAVVVFSRWHPVRAMWGALIFGFASALQLRLQAVGANIPNQFLLMLPYLLTILVLISVSKKAEFPSAYAKPYSRMER
jgi:simple sugar transport system permease protein